jgi:hypothetical protein
MIIEGAFYKRPELLLGHAFPSWQYESTLTNHKAMAVLLELNARNISLPQGRIHIERPYPVEKPGPANRSDLYVDLDGVFAHGQWWPSYGIKAKNWVEVKFHGGIGRTSGTETKTGNAGRTVKDILRLCLFVEEERSRHRDNGRYLLVGFNRERSAYLAFHKRSPNWAERSWLRSMLSPGSHHLQISLKDEARSFKEEIGRKFENASNPLELTLDVVTYSFEPYTQPTDFLYWGYLIRIVKLRIRLGTEELVYKDDDEDIWPEEKTAQQRYLVERVLELM